MTEQVRISKLVHGGQAIGDLADGRKVFVWNALPGELVEVQITRKRKDYCEGIAEKIIESSPERVSPKDEAYLSTSPWQILDFEAENKYKKNILEETLSREKISYDREISLSTDNKQWRYRNKMEYSFWADESGLHLALFNRGSHGKRIVPGSSIARREIDETATKILVELNKAQIRGSQLKTLVVRCNQQGETVAALFVKDEEFPKLPSLQADCIGMVVCYSTPKSPASVLTRQLYKFGDVTLSDDLLGTNVKYGVNSFFQVNIPVFELALNRIGEYLNGCEKIDLYCGVGSIGVALGSTEVFVDTDAQNCEYARINVAKSGKVVHANSEYVLDYVSANQALIVDPPRAGMHRKLVDRINEVKPLMVAYLSCNPSTQARDLSLLETNYELKTVEGYNFFPKTPHIESLAVMIRK